MIAYIVEHYLSHSDLFEYNNPSDKWLEVKTLSTLSEAEEFLCEHFDSIVTSLDESADIATISTSVLWVSSSNVNVPVNFVDKLSSCAA